MVAQRVRIPYTVGLVLAGVALSFFPFGPRLELSKELIFTVLLPPLIFEATLFIRWRELIYNLPVILLFATIGVVFSAILTVAGMVYLAQWAWPSAILFGVLIAATDPVSVIATFKEAGVHGRLRLLVEAESLFNDAAAAVAFSIALAFASGVSITLFGTVQTLIITVAGGILCGVLVAGSVLLLAGQTDVHLIEITLNT